MTPALEFRNVWKRFGGLFEVLRGLDFALASREIALMVGENGAGKTTSFEIACGNIPLDQGDVRVSGISVKGRTPQGVARLGLRRMYQKPAIFPSLSIRDNVLIGHSPGLYARLVPWPRERARNRLWKKLQKRVSDLFSRCDFLDQPERPAAELSFGQQRIVEFLRVFAGCERGAKVVLLDEPFAGIHPDVVSTMWKMIKQLASSGLAVLMVEHQDQNGFLQDLRKLRLSQGRLS